MANLQVVPDGSDSIEPNQDHYAVEQFINEMRQRHAAELRVLQNRINRLVEENTGLHGQIVELTNTLDMAEYALQQREQNDN